MSALSRTVTSNPALDLLVRLIAIALVACLIFVGLPFLAEHAG